MHCCKDFPISKRWCVTCIGDMCDPKVRFKGLVVPSVHDVSIHLILLCIWKYTYE